MPAGAGDSWHTRPVLVPITTEVVVAEAERLGAGGYRYTSRQLYYAVCRAVARPDTSITKGFIALGALLVVLAGALLFVRSVPISPVLAALGVVSLLAAPVNARLERGRELRRVRRSLPLAASLEEFTASHLEEARRSRPEAFSALLAIGPPPADPAAMNPAAVDPAGASAPAASAIAPSSAAGTARPGPLIVSDRRETAALLAANAGRLPDGVEVAELAGLSLGHASEPARRVRERRLVAVHDADPGGCGLPAALRQAGATDVVDAGLRPPASDAGFPIIEGAPARLPAGIAEDLDPDQLGWLGSGRRLELATLTPDEVVGLVLAALAPDPARPQPDRVRPV